MIGMRGEESKDVLRALCKDIGLSKTKTMVEIGCYAGESTEVFAEFCKTVYAIDPWLDGMELANGTSAGDTLKMEKVVEAAFDKRMANLPGVKKIKAFDQDVVSDFKDGSLNFVYIDALHTEEELLRQIDMWLPKIKKNGVIGGHDYNERFPGIMNAVNIKFGKPDKIYHDGGNSWINRV